MHSSGRFETHDNLWRLLVSLWHSLFDEHSAEMLIVVLFPSLVDPDKPGERVVSACFFNPLDPNDAYMRHKLECG